MDTTISTLDWDAIYWEYLPRVHRYFCYQVGDSALAEDLTATTFVKAWKARASYKPARSSLVTWLMTIARNTATDYFRRERLALPLETVRLPVTDERPVEDALQEALDFVRLRELMETLSPRERELIALKYGAGMTNRMVAHVLDMSETNVSTILYRTVYRLRAAWEAAPNDQ